MERPRLFGSRSRMAASTLIAGDLDMNNGNNSIGVSPDGHHVYLALASAGAPDNKARHQPNASRWLGIYELDIATGARRPVVTSEQDNYDPSIAGGSILLDAFFTAQSHCRISF